MPELQEASVVDIAREKCRQAAIKLGGQRAVIIEDTALCFSAFGGNLPGAYIKWFLNDLGPEGVIKTLSAFPDKCARAICTFAYYPANNILENDKVNGVEIHVPTDEEILVFQGVTDGVIVDEPRYHVTKVAFSWDSIFQPDDQEPDAEYPKTFAEMSAEFKNSISHRRKGLDLLVAHFNNDGS